MAYIFLRTLLLTSLLLATPFLLGYLFLSGNGELLEVDEIAKKQTDLAKQGTSPCIAGSALFPLGFYYKQALYIEAKPKSIALGSSRVMQFRKRFFTSSFINMGGGMGSLEEGQALLNEILNSNTPEHVVFGVDAWWFNEAYQSPEQRFRTTGYREHLPTAQQLLQPYAWLSTGKLTWAELTRNLGLNTTLTPDCSIGVAGKFSKKGFSADGSYYATPSINGAAPFLESRNFKDALNRITKGIRRFEYGQTASEERIRIFMGILKTLKNRNIHVSIFFPPFAPTVYEQLEEVHLKYAYIHDLKSTLTARGVKYHDFSNPATLNSDNCEFLDGFHGGDLTYAKILLKIAEADADARPYLNIDLLKQQVETYKSIAFLPDAEITSDPEVDFLGLGCIKTSGRSL